MSVDSDVALLGTGLAPLVAANHLLSEGKSVLVLNPDWDFFVENSEFPLDPICPLSRELLAPERLLSSDPARVMGELSPLFPGAIETWPHRGTQGYHDRFAPYIRERSRLWVFSRENAGLLEDMYVEASDAGLNPQILEGIIAQKRFPGVSLRSPKESIRALALPKQCDTDLSRYRNGLLEFVKERLEQERIVCQASQIELFSGGVRYHADGSSHTSRLKDGMLVFWTPKLLNWVLNQAKKAEIPLISPRGIRLWEQWTLYSRERLDPNVIGVFEDMTIWSEEEGAPDLQQGDSNRLSVLRPGALMKMSPSGGYISSIENPGLASSDSFSSLARLCFEWLQWEKISIRSMKPRFLFEWEVDPNDLEDLSMISSGGMHLRIVPGCEGSLQSVVKRARSAAASLLRQGGAV